jgi:ParB-like chromosome segregation protein Spo0J
VSPAETSAGEQGPPRIESFPIERVPVDSLVFSGSPRRAGEDQQHIRLLAEATEPLPPIVVHRPTMRVIDGFHRVQAARLNNRATIAARMVDCDEDMAFVLAVEANVTHGLPLSRVDRAAAAERIIASHPHWSDRAIAAATGLSDKTVSGIRTRCGAPATARTGRDGRVRPLDVGTRREQAATAIRQRPDAGLREIARAIGLSPATVRDVRQRIARGEHPVPDRYRSTDEQETAATPKERPATTGAPSEATMTPIEARRLLRQLGDDPTLRHSEAGRRSLQLLYRHLIYDGQLTHLNHGLPDHWAPHVAHLARTCASAWHQLADQLQRRAA